MCLPAFGRELLSLPTHLNVILYTQSFLLSTHLRLSMAEHARTWALALLERARQCRNNKDRTVGLACLKNQTRQGQIVLFAHNK